MSGVAAKHLTDLLETVQPRRRDLLKRLLIGSVVAVFAPGSTLLAAPEGQGQGKGKGGGGKGKGKGKGKGTPPGS